MHRTPFFAIAFSVVAMCGISPAALGASVQRFDQNASGVCQGALPAFSGTLRARPLALQNEGTTPAFVTCSLQSQTTTSGGASPRVQRINLYIRNSSTTGTTLSCTLVDGPWNETPVYLAKTINVPGGGGGMALMSFQPSEYAVPATVIRSPNVSCNLPPGMGITSIWTEVLFP